jgi:recombination protein RecT
MSETAEAIKAIQNESLPAKADPRQVIRQTLDHYKPVVHKLLVGTGINEETFTAWVANAMRAAPKLWACEPATVLGATLRCAQLGLAPNDSRNLAWIIPYGRDATFQIGYGGVMELARRAVPGLRFDGRPVFPNDEFALDYGNVKPLTHIPAFVNRLERGGDAYAWYVKASFPDGSEQIHALDREGVEYHRSFSKTKNAGMWVDNYDAAALKSVVMDMKRWLPSSAQLAAGMASDETTMTPEDVGEIDHYPTTEAVEPGT